LFCHLNAASVGVSKNYFIWKETSKSLCSIFCGGTHSFVRDQTNQLRIFVQEKNFIFRRGHRLNDKLCC